MTGAHVPHPAISMSIHRQVTIELSRPSNLWLDGRRWASASTLVLTVEPDALVVCV